jgi:hypothetical protein
VHQKLGDVAYWVGGSDQNCVGKFSWCDIDRPFAKWVTWYENQPGNGQAGSCVSLYYNGAYMKGQQKSGYFSIPYCTETKQFICEVNIHFIQHLSCFM